MIAALLLSSFAFSQTATKPDFTPAELYQPLPQAPAQATVLTHRNRLRAQTNYAQSTFDQTGTGRTYTTGKGNSLGINLTHDYTFSPERIIQSQLLYQPANFVSPTNSSQQTISRTHLSSAYGWQRQRSASFSYDLLAGVQFTDRQGFSDSQNLSSSSRSLGPLLGTQATWTINDQLSVNGSFQLSIPLWFQEQTKTGFFEQGLGSITRLSAQLRLTKRLKASVGVMLETEELEFSGSGNRSVTDARLRYQALSFPVGVEYVF